MSRLISDILQAPEPHFSHTIKDWEQKSNRAGHDLRLLSNVALARKKTLKNLNLDIDDTTAKELYYTLRHHASQTNKELEKRIGINQKDAPSLLIDKIIDFVDKLKVPKDVWVIKHTVVKEMLKKQPPKKLLKTLGLRSIDSVLKRTSGYEILALAYEVESPEWIQKMRSKLKKLKQTDFEVKKINIFGIPSTKTNKLRKAGHLNKSPVIPCYEIGTILVTPPKKRFNLDTLSLTFSLLQCVYDMRFYSTYYRYMSVKADFGKRIYNSSVNGLPGKLQELRIGWRSLHKHLERSDDSFQKIEQPYLQSEHLIALEPIEVLSGILPSSRIWKEAKLVFINEADNTTSAHLMDVLINSANQLPYEQSTNIYLRNHMWEEIGSSYLKSPSIEAVVIQDIEEE